MSEHMPKEPLPKSVRKARPSTTAAPTTAEGPNSEMLRLQRLVGNHAVQRMLIQPKMTVGAADDPYEREADAVADQVMAQRDTSIQRAGEEEELQAKRIDIVQRAEEEEELAMKRVDIVQRESEEEEDESIQAKRVDIVQRESEEEEDESIQAKRIDIVQRAPVSVNDDEELEAEADQMGAQAMRKEDEQVDMNGSFDVDQDIESRISAQSGSGQTIPD